MKRQSLGLALYAIMVYLTCPALNPAVADLNVGEPRTVRLIYFLPNDRPYRAYVVQQMKDEIREVQRLYAEQMEAHGYGRKTFDYETDDAGEPVVHRVDGQTVIPWFLLKEGPARLEGYALTGQRVAVLHEGPHKAGFHLRHWDGRDDQGRPLASGVYLYRLATSQGTQTRKLTLLR